MMGRYILGGDMRKRPFKFRCGQVIPCGMLSFALKKRILSIMAEKRRSEGRRCCLLCIVERGLIES